MRCCGLSCRLSWSGYRRRELRLAELERRLGSDSTTSGTPPSKDPIGPRERRKAERKARQTSERERRADRSRGGQPGHPGAGLSRDPDPDEREEVPPPAECSRCGTTLDGADRAGSWWSQVRDVKITTFVTEYLLPLLACPCCGKINAAQAPPWAHPGRHLLRSGHQYRRGAADLLRERARRTSREPDRHAARRAGLGGVRRWRQRTAVVPAGRRGVR